MTEDPGAGAGRYRGSCACGAVRFTATGPLRPIVACHCRQCRKMSGHFVAASEAPEGNLRFGRDDGLRWYDSSAQARRGFCGFCGSTLFFKLHARAHVAIFAGALDDFDGLRLAGHLHAGDAAPYYEIADGLPLLDRAAIDALAGGPGR